MPNGRSEERVPPARPGQHVAHYEIMAELGRGGMGVVYRARDTQLDREVALKCPWPSLASDPTQRQRFIREAKASSRLSDPHIVQVLDVFEHGGIPWLVLQLIEGQTLLAILEGEGKLEPPRVLRYGEDLASALVVAHDHGVLHRDINPRNVLVPHGGQAMLSDFGLARFYIPDGDLSSAATQSDVLTKVGDIVGTPGYMSPEQALGKPVDPRSDIFSLGTLLYQMCTGAQAFAASSHGAVLNAILHREPEPISRFTYAVPPELERIIQKALAKRPDERYQTSMDLLTDLRALRRRLEVDEFGPAPDLVERATRPRLWVAAAIGVGIVAVIAWILVWAPWQELGDRGLPRGAPTQVTSGPEWEGDPAIAPGGRQLAYTSDEAGNPDIYVVDVTGGASLRLTDDPATDQSPAWFPSGSELVFTSDRNGGDAIWKVGRLGGGATMVIPDARDPAISPDGSHIAFARLVPADGFYRIGVTPLDNPGAAYILTSNRDGVWNHRNPNWSPNGRTICYSSHGNLWTVAADGDSPPSPLTTGDAVDFDPTFSADGRHLYFSSYREGTLALWRMPAAGGEPVRLTLGTGPESQAAVATDGSRLGYSTMSSRRQLFLVDLQRGEETGFPQTYDEWMVTIRPDRRRVVYAARRQGSKQDLWEQTLEHGRPIGNPRRLTDLSGDASHPAFSPNGQWLAFYRIVEDRRDIWLLPSIGGTPVQITDHPAADIHPAWSPDGRFLAFASARGGGFQIWTIEVDAGGAMAPPRSVTPADLIAVAPDWSADGGDIAFVGGTGNDSDAWLVSLVSSEGPRRITREAGAHRVHWDSRSGDLLVSGSWGGKTIGLYRVPVNGGVPSPTDPAIAFGTRTIYDGFQQSAFGGFDISSDGTLMVYSRETVRGDIWVLEAISGRY